jgi:thiamine kinase-like enzyme
MDGAVAQAAQIIALLPCLRELAVDAPVRRLGGLTNSNFLVGTEPLEFVVRIPGEGTSEYINRAHEAVALQLAASAGVTVDVAHFDPSSGVLVTRYLRAAETMSSELFRDHERVKRAAIALKKLHCIKERLPSDFRLFTLIDNYKAILRDKMVALPHGFEEAEIQSATIRSALEKQEISLVPSHCDPLCENFLDDGQEMRIIDFEYAGNNDPMWDLADLSVEGKFDDQQDKILLQAYFSGTYREEDASRMQMYKALCDLLWSLWGVIQHVNGNDAEDFWQYANMRFERFKTLIETPSFKYYLHILNANHSVIL